MGKPNFKEMKAKQREQAKAGNAYKTDDDKKSYADERFYKISKNSDGNGEVELRLLPSLNMTKDDLATFVTRKVHSVNTIRPGTDGKDNNDKRWRTFLCAGDDCPVCKKGWELYNDTKKSLSDKYPNPTEDQQKANKTTTSAILNSWLGKEEYITNVLIVNDPVTPENNGKVFLFELKKGMIEMLDKHSADIIKTIDQAEVYKDSDPEKYEEMLSDAFISKDVETFDAYDLEINGKNLKLEFINKKDSRWKKPADYWGNSKVMPRFKPAVKNDDEFQELIEKAYCLDEFSNPNEFKDAKKTVMSNELLEDEVGFLTFDIEDISKHRKQRIQDKKDAEAGVTSDSNAEELTEETKVPEKKSTAKDRMMKKVNTETVETVVEETPAVEEVQEDVVTPEVQQEVVEATATPDADEAPIYDESGINQFGRTADEQEMFVMFGE